MIPQKVLKTIKDSSIKDYRKVNDVFEVDIERLEQMKKSLGNKFDLYFLVIKGNKVKKTKK
jgi:hypothetical protein